MGRSWAIFHGAAHNKVADMVCSRVTAALRKQKPLGCDGKQWMFNFNNRDCNQKLDMMVITTIIMNNHDKIITNNNI